MVTLTAANLTALVNDKELSSLTAETIIDQAVNMINGYGVDLPNMSGTAGNKSLSCESGEAGWIINVASEIYVKSYKNSGNPPTAVTNTVEPNKQVVYVRGSTQNTNPQETARLAAIALKPFDSETT